LENDGSSWFVVPDWEHTRGLYYDLFSVETTTSTTHSALCKCFSKERVFVKIIDALLGITGASTESECKWASHCAEGYFIDDGKLWHLGGATPTHAVAHWECVNKLEATQLTREEHVKVHMHCDHIKMQLLDKIYSPLLDASITTAILKCEHCKNFGSMHLHSLLAPIT